MGARFFYCFLFFLAMNVAHWSGDLSTAGAVADTSDYEFADLAGDPSDPTIRTTDQGIQTLDPQEKATNDKIDAILNQFNMIEKINSFNGSLSPQNTAWSNIRQKNLKSIIPSSLPVFDFTAISAASPLESLMLSNVAALAFCKGKTDPAKRDLKHSTISGSIFKKGVQAGVGAIAGNKQAFTLPPLGTGTATCANIKQRFCENVCTTGLCGADPLYGAVCIRGCWGPDFFSNTKIQQCHQQFILRYVNNTPGAAANPCAIKKLQLEEKGAAARFIAGASGAKASYILADQCVAVGAGTNAAALGLIGTLCTQLFQTCSLSQQDRQNLSSLLNQMHRTGQVPTTPVGVGVPTTSPLLSSLMASMTPPGYPGGLMGGMMPGMSPGMSPGGMPGMFPGGVPGGMPGGMPGYPANYQTGYPGGPMPGMSPYASPVGNIQPPVLYNLGGPMGGPYGQQGQQQGQYGQQGQQGQYGQQGQQQGQFGQQGQQGQYGQQGQQGQYGQQGQQGQYGQQGQQGQFGQQGQGGGQFGQGGGGGGADPCDQSNQQTFDQDMCTSNGNTPYGGQGGGGGGNFQGGGNQNGQDSGDPCDSTSGSYNPGDPSCQ